MEDGRWAKMRELKFIETIMEMVKKPSKGVKIGIGDDAAAVEYSWGKYLLLSADMLIEGTHFDLKKASLKMVGRKAVAVNISDIAAMGGIPRYVLVSIGMPKKFNARAVKEFYKGIKEISREYGVDVIGGDLNRSKTLVVDVSIVGFVEKKFMITRSGAKAGDLVLVTGPVRNGRRTHLNFAPRFRESRFLATGYKVNSMIDVSDGIGVDLMRVCKASGVGCKIFSDAVPLSRGLSLKDALYYGESFELLFTMPARDAKKLLLDLKEGESDLNYFIIGEIVQKKEGCWIIKKEGRKEKLRMDGFRHF
jgi:thiamine-monophosphate kinase